MNSITCATSGVQERLHQSWTPKDPVLFSEQFPSHENTGRIESSWRLEESWREDCPPSLKDVETALLPNPTTTSCWCSGKTLVHLEMITYLHVVSFQLTCNAPQWYMEQTLNQFFHIVFFLHLLFIFSTWYLLLSKFDVQTCSHIFVIDAWYVSFWSLKVSFNTALYCIQTEYPTGLDGWGHVETPSALSLL